MTHSRKYRILLYRQQNIIERPVQILYCMVRNSDIIFLMHVYALRHNINDGLGLVTRTNLRLRTEWGNKRDI